jgi:hypothetical protein
MNAISINRVSDSGAVRAAEVEISQGFGSGAHNRVAVWLPVPRLSLVRVNLPLESLRAQDLFPPASAVHWSAERFLFGLLALAAMAGVVYSFSQLLDLVQNWALFENGIGRLLQ